MHFKPCVTPSLKCRKRIRLHAHKGDHAAVTKKDMGPSAAVLWSAGSETLLRFACTMFAVHLLTSPPLRCAPRAPS
ncbi:hypothetical protein NDU88_000701 [Pleurodeles waltl]|uniref:Uncharacterized protein n=1 Tax=Pleurodeles waltl TaxID=8319 RepID=A0AAV7TFP6_PLEWA|nr:hypothetical protein NDU88_000701 [Pleurodeles waltl]